MLRLFATITHTEKSLKVRQGPRNVFAANFLEVYSATAFTRPSKLPRRRAMKRCLCLLLCLGYFAIIAARRVPDSHRQPFEKAKNTANSKTPVIIYHGGPLMVNATDLYVIYYGSFTSTQHAILDTFLQNLGGSGAYNVNNEYTDGWGNPIMNILNYTP